MVSGLLNGAKIARNDRIENYLAALAKAGNKTNAAKMTGIPRQTLTKWRSNIEDFRDREAEAMEEFRGMLLDVAIDRAVNGWEKPVVHQGQYQYVKDPVTREWVLDENGDFVKVTVTQKDNQLLLKLLEANIPQFHKNPETLISIGGMDDEAPAIKIMWGNPDGSAGAPVMLEDKGEQDIEDAEFEEIKEEPKEEIDIFS